MKSSVGSKFKQLIMASSSNDDEMHLVEYVKSIRGVYRGAPEGSWYQTLHLIWCLGQETLLDIEIERMVGGPCGIILCMDSPEDMYNKSPLGKSMSFKEVGSHR